MSNIKINPGKLRAAASRLDRLTDKLQEEEAAIASAKGAIEDAWVSESRDILTDDIEITRSNVRKLENATQNLASGLRRIIDEAERIERLNAAGFGGGGGGVRGR